VSDERIENLMQAALDNEASSQEEAELAELLDNDTEQAQAFDAQRQVDDMLRYPPHERAPKRLAMAIMAKLAQTIQEQQTAQSPVTEAQLRVAFQLVTVTALPLLVGAGYMLLNAQTKQESVEAVLEQVVLIMMIMLESINVLLDEAEQVYQEDPEMALALLTMIPSTLLILVQEILGIEDDE
jgi:anti-sigma factor RsiW